MRAPLFRVKSLLSSSNPLLTPTRKGGTLSCLGGSSKKGVNSVNSLHSKNHESLDSLKSSVSGLTSPSTPIVPISSNPNSSLTLPGAQTPFIQTPTSSEGPLSNNKSSAPSPAIPLDYESPNSPNSDNPTSNTLSSHDVIFSSTSTQTELIPSTGFKSTFFRPSGFFEGCPNNLHLEKYESFLFFSGYSRKDIEDLLSKARLLGKERRTFRDWDIYRHEEGASDLFNQFESPFFKQVVKSSFQEENAIFYNSYLPSFFKLFRGHYGLNWVCSDVPLALPGTYNGLTFSFNNFLGLRDFFFTRLGGFNNLQGLNVPAVTDIHCPF